MSHLIRTTMRPWEEIEVSDADYLDMQRQGLIHTPAPAPPVPAPAVRQAAPKKSPAAPVAGTTKEG